MNDKLLFNHDSSEQPGKSSNPKRLGNTDPVASEANLRELNCLVSLAQEGTATDKQHKRMEELVCADTNCCRFYITAMCIHASLPKYCSTDSSDARLFELLSSIGSCDIPEDLAVDCTLQSDCRIDVSSEVSSTIDSAQVADSRPYGARNISLRGIRPLPAIAVSVLLLMMTTVMASESIRAMIREILLPSRFTLAEGSGGLTHSKNPGRVIRGPNIETGTRRIGSSGHDDVSLASLFVFPLPAFKDIDQVHSARLEWTLKQKDANPDFHTDLYGLGYVRRGEPTGQGFWEGELDDSLRIEYGMRGSRRRPVQLIQASVMSPESETGRIRIENQPLVKFLRSLYTDGAQAGDLVVFRLNSHESTLAKPRAMGYGVVHAPAVPGLTKPAEFPMLWVTARRSVAADEFAVARESLSAQSMVARLGSGVVRSQSKKIEQGSRDSGIRTIGSSAKDNQSLAVALLFTLPPIDEMEDIEFASLEFSTIMPIGSPEFSVDLYGLGYSSSGTYTKPCFWEGESDPHSSDRYHLLGNSAQGVPLIARGLLQPGDSESRVLVEGSKLVGFLRSLYEHGARGGDTVVFRLNADCPTAGIRGANGYRIILPPARENVDPLSLPVLSVTAKKSDMSSNGNSGDSL